MKILMNREKFLAYVEHFNNKNYDAVTSYFTPDITVEYYTSWSNPLAPARTLYGSQGFIDSYRFLHEHCREVLELRDFMVSDNLMFAELYTEFHCFKDHPTFSARPLKEGDSVIMTNWVMYDLEGDKFKRIRIAHFRFHDIHGITMVGNNVYIRLAEKMGAPASERLLKILEEMFTPEESELLLELFVPATCQELASRLKMDAKSLSAVLENLVDRGVLTKGKTQYAFHTSLLAFHHDVIGDTAVMPIPEKLRELWGDFFYNEWTDSFLNTYIRRQEETGRPVHRVWPAIGALELSPNIRPEEILPEENWQLIIENAKRRIIAPCGCRAPWGKCEHSVMTCFANFDNDRGEYYLGKPGRQLAELSLEETLNRVRSLEEEGLVHVGACYCCPDACEILYSLTRAKRFDLLGPSRYLATVNEELCNGCQGCVDRCYFDAVEMQKPANSKKLKASINSEKCLGCGLCIVSCKQKAMRFELVRPPEFIQDKRRQDKTPTNLWGFYHLD